MILVSRPGPDNPPVYSNFGVKTEILEEPEGDYILVENLYLSVDPALRQLNKTE